jgi:hypothetical protein
MLFPRVILLLVDFISNILLANVTSFFVFWFFFFLHFQVILYYFFLYAYSQTPVINTSYSLPHWPKVHSGPPSAVEVQLYAPPTQKRSYLDTGELARPDSNPRPHSHDFFSVLVNLQITYTINDNIYIMKNILTNTIRQESQYA